jgi:hypothetical protein
VLRGKWLLEAVLGTPPPPPPANVPPLDESKGGETPATLRERLAQHRANPACASCHDRIDPLGFALENYDVLGRWRTEEAGKPIDARGELPDGTAFEGPDQLKAALMQKKDLFVQNFTKKMLGYALGRGLTLQDQCTVDSIVAEVERSNYSAHALINAVVLSVPFRYQAPRDRSRSHRGLRNRRSIHDDSTAEGDVPADGSARGGSCPRATLAGGDGAVHAGCFATGGREVARSHGCAVHGQRREHNAVDARRGGKGLPLSPTLQPLEDLKDQLLVVSNLWNAAANTGDGHYTKESSLLTCTTITKTLGVDINIHGPSMDQVAAQRVGDQTPLPSLELGIEPESTGVDANVGYTRVYGCHIAWSSPTTPLARDTNPRSVYARLFRAAGPAGNTAKQDTHLLDRVLEQSKRMRAKLGAADQARVDEYLSIVRSLETRMERASDPKRAWKPLASLDSTLKPTDNPTTHEEHVRLMLDMIAVAFQSDTTRISTFMFGNAVSGVNFRFLEGVTDSHHEISHHSKDPEKLRQYALINRWHVAQYGYLLRKLRDMKEGDRSVLDNSMVLFGSALSDGNSHNPHRCLWCWGAGAAGGSRRGSTWCIRRIRRRRICMCRCWMRSGRRWSGSGIVRVRCADRAMLNVS